MANWWNNLQTGFGDALIGVNNPYGFAPPEGYDRNAAMRAGALNLGVNMLANADRNPAEAIGRGYRDAQEQAGRQQMQSMAAQEMMARAEENRLKREEERKRQQMMEEQIAQLPPELQGLARIAPEKVFGNVIDSQFGSADVPASVQEWQIAQQNGYTGSLADWKTLGKNSQTVNVNMPGEISDAALRKKLDEQEGQLLKDYKAAGAVSGSNAADFEVLDELVKIAPQGPITGRLAAAVPGVSSAGDAFQSIVKRIAPTLRAPGSGATSDIEYEGMLRSLPALSNKPEANQMILEIMKAKADLNIRRADIITQYQVGEIDAGTMRREIAALDRQSIMTPEMKNALMGISGSSGAGGKTSTGVPWKVENP